ncbi:type I restriction enzyme HsdR N-terminal domain-containing protein [Anabaena cylindrica UHCC 0172]|uniref:type I restriction enzyme HsdR N-terminal domain-containing protein n=1 Tax=Anabaena cylindrica TaxID=1165 RepID=UPI002B201A05|nr:type I restriction enzyme HsdR N-terminal domain-containing protein [Anabaena cylindrica]MEA5552571.1 type I restriction enzyme HsdR N-terminal domain-containing protein [Anabaena cylindrica UHCC 0172]
MTQTLPASKLSLYDVKTKFHLQQIESDTLFAELLQSAPPLNEFEKQILDRTRQQYLYLADRPLLEVTVKMVTLSPLLSLAGFYDPPFYTTLEESVEVVSQDGSETVRGQIDVLVLQNTIWVVVIEAKSIQYDVMVALPQALTYMIASPNQKSKELFGMISNGREFRFIKLTQEPSPTYTLSKIFSLSETENQLYEVLQILKSLGQLTISS